MLYVNLIKKSIGETAKVKDIRKFGLIKASEVGDDERDFS